MQTAVDIVAGNSLWHVVVEDDEVASNILQRMNASKAEGRVTFLPLNRVGQKLPAYPEGQGKCCCCCCCFVL